jgi:methyl-accepting chemotaxis protein
MSSISIPLLAMTSVNIYMSIYYSIMYFIGVKTKEYLLFSFVCLSVGFYDIFAMGLYNSHSLDEALIWQKLEIDTIWVISIFITWFLLDYTKSANKKIKYFLMSVFVIFFIVTNIPIDGFSISESSPESIKKINVFNIIKVTYYERDVGLIFTIGFFISALTYIYLLYNLIKYYKKTKNKHFIVVIISQIIYFIGMLNDILMPLGVYKFIYVSEYAFFLIICASSYLLLVDSLNTHKTLEIINTNLENKVTIIKNMAANVHKTTIEVVSGTDRLEKYSSNMKVSFESIARAMEEIAENAVNQSGQSQNMSNNMDSLSSNMNIMLDNVGLVSSTTIKTKDLSSNSLNVINELNDKTQDVNNAINKVLSQVTDLNDDINNITMIIKIILRIINQTNLLAINATIESAKAGEAGKGFYIVANEIKKLSNQSKTSLSDINKIISNIIDKTSSVVYETTNASLLISSQMESVKVTNDSFNHILKGATEIFSHLDRTNESISIVNTLKFEADEFVKNIVLDSSTSASVTEQVNATIQDQIDVTHQIAKLTANLNSMAVNLNNDINTFTL